MARTKKVTADTIAADESTLANDVSQLQADIASQESASQATTLPASITLIAPYAYFDAEGVAHGWAQGDTVTDASEIADLIARGARYK